MDNTFHIPVIGVLALFVIFVLFGATLIFPWHTIDWGKIQLSPTQTVVVTGQARLQQRNQIARFSAGVSAVNDDRDTAVNEVNQKIEAIIAALETFGIPAEDIQTQNLNVFRNEASFVDDGVQKSRPGQWRVNNTLSIVLRDVDRAGELATLLTQSGATNINGPSLTVEDTDQAESELIADAIANARQKAQNIATASGRRLGKVISVTEGQRLGPVTLERFGAGLGGGSSVPIEPGSSTISTSVTVTFELL